MSLKDWLFTNAFLLWAIPEAASLAYALVYLLFWLMIMNVFYRFRVFIKI